MISFGTAILPTSCTGPSRLRRCSASSPSCSPTSSASATTACCAPGVAVVGLDDLAERQRGAGVQHIDGLFHTAPPLVREDREEAEQRHEQQDVGRMDEHLARRQVADPERAASIPYTQDSASWEESVAPRAICCASSTATPNRARCEEKGAGGLGLVFATANTSAGPKAMQAFPADARAARCARVRPAAPPAVAPRAPHQKRDRNGEHEPDDAIWVGAVKPNGPVNGTRAAIANTEHAQERGERVDVWAGRAPLAVPLDTQASLRRAARGGRLRAGASRPGAPRRGSGRAAP